MLILESVMAGNLFPAYAGTTCYVAGGGQKNNVLLPPHDPAAGELGEEEREGRLVEEWPAARSAAAGVVAGGRRTLGFGLPRLQWPPDL